MHRMLLELPESFDTARLHVRRYHAGDGPAYWAMAQRNRDHLLPFEAGNPALTLKSEEEAEILMREFAAAWGLRERFFLGAWDRETGVFVAQLYIGSVTPALREYEIGYFVEVDHEGQGYVTEAVRGALQFIFEHLQAQRVRLRCSDLNPRSARVAERCGFTREAHLRQSQILSDGRIGGEFYYGLLRAEYLEGQKT